MRMHWLFALTVLAGACDASAAGIVNPTVEGNRLTATVSLAGEFEARLSVEFESVVGLSPENLGLSADVVSLESTDILSRLPDVSIALTSGFPVRVSIDPPAQGGLSFAGAVSVELYTHNLHYDPSLPLRLFSAEAGGSFRDITQSVGSGSYRTDGSKGQFSEFLIVLDSRSTDAVTAEKFQRLDDLLSEHGPSISPSLAAHLQDTLDAAQSDFQSGLYSSAIQEVEAFADAVEAAAGEGQIPNVWRSTRDIDNVAGLLRAAAGTLRFSLTLLANGL